MSQHTERSDLQATLQHLNKFLGQVATRKCCSQSCCECLSPVVPFNAGCNHPSCELSLLQTYITICEEVARAEYAVQADMRILRDLELQMSISFETYDTQQEEPSGMPDKLCCVPNHTE